MALKVTRKETTKHDVDTVIAKAKPKKAKKDPSANLLRAIEEARLDIEANLGEYKQRYRVISTVSDLSAYIDHANLHGVISTDTETLGKNPILHNIVGFSLSTPDLDGVYVPINHIDYMTGERVEGQLSIEDVRKVLSKLTAKVVMFNAGFDRRVFLRWVGLKLPCYWDCSIAAHLLNENEPSFKLKDLHAKYILENGKKGKSFGDLFKKITFNLIPIEVGYIYAAHDAVITMEYYLLQRKYLNEHGSKGLDETYRLFMDVEMPCVDAVIGMEEYGVALNVDLIHSHLLPKYDMLMEEAKAECESALLELKPKIDAYVATNPGCGLTNPINPNSTNQLKIILYDILHLKSPDKKNPTGTGADIIQGFNIPLTNAVLKLRGVQKIRNTYVTKMLREAINGRVHCRFNQNGATTGRFSSSSPNLQNIPTGDAEIRQMFQGSVKEYQLDLNKDDNTFVLEKSFEVDTANRGFVFAERLQVGDVLSTDEGLVTIKSVRSEEGLLGKVVVEIVVPSHSPNS